MKRVMVTTRVGGNRIVRLQDGAKVYLPPIRKDNKNMQPRTDFHLLGRAIVGNLGFAELSKEVHEIKNDKRLHQIGKGKVI